MDTEAKSWNRSIADRILEDLDRFNMKIDYYREHENNGTLEITIKAIKQAWEREANP